MKIVFVCSEDKWLGVGYLSSYLKEHNHEAHLLFDPLLFNKSYIRNERLKNAFSADDKFVKRIKKIEPDLIGFSVVTANYQWALDMAATFKKHFQIPIIFGGPHPTVIPEEVISNSQVDMIALGEAEESLRELLDTCLQKKDIKGIWFREEREVMRNPLRQLEADLDKYPFPDEDLFYRELPPSYRLTPSVLTSRGCPFSCTYCGNRLMQKIYRNSGSSNWVRQRSVENLIAELIWRKETHKSRHFVFMDDIFASNINWLKAFTREYKRKVNLPFNCLSHPSFAKEETIKLLKQAGCTMVNFGLQSGSSRIRKTVLSRNEKDGEVIEVARACKKYRLRFAVDCILNLPLDNEESIKESMNFFNAIHPDIINCYRLLYFPGTKIVDIAKERGLINAEDIDMINKGKKNRYSSIGIAHKENLEDDYRKYAFLFIAMPLLPKQLVRKIINSGFLFNLFQKSPPFLLPFIKVVVQMKANFGFIFFNVLGNEIFYLKKVFRGMNREN